MRTNNHITTGAPKILVIALIGSTFIEPGSWAIVSQINIKIAPQQSTAGIKILWSVVWNSCRVKCGTANPIKAMGPAKAVIHPAKRPAAMIII